MDSVKRTQKLPHIGENPVPAGSKRNSLLARAMAMSNTGIAFVRADLLTGKNLMCNSSWEREK